MERIFENWSMAYQEVGNVGGGNIEKQLFIDNFIAISEFREKSTHSTKLFWYISKQILEEE